MLEIRGHARGGQGMVTAFEILAKIFGQMEGYYVQAFPAFGVERTGAPIQAFLRVSKTPILNRSKIYNPDLIVVFDETLLDQVPIFDGLEKNGAALLNTEKPIDKFKNFTENIFTVPATRISLEKGLGSKALPIVNSAMIGAILKVMGEPLDIAKDIIAANVPTKPEANVEAAEVAHNSVNGLTDKYTYIIDAFNSDKPKQSQLTYEERSALEKKEIKDLPKYPEWYGPMSKNKTGNWRVLTPEYHTNAAPCSLNCPAGTAVREFVDLANKKSFEEGFKLILEHNPFPAICGRVCPHYCEQNCNRKDYDESLNIGSIERFLGDRNKDYKPTPVEITKKEKIAVIGGGPAGLTAALRLRNMGYRVTVFEALPKAGGMMRAGIPKFRLPDEVLDREIKRIEDSGVEIITNKKVTVKELENDFDAVIVAVGSHKGYTMGMKNEELALDGIDFLREFKLNNNTSGIKKGDKVAIIGGGNTAIDVSRTALRLGAEPTIYYRRTRNEMPAIHIEVEEAIEEGVNFEFLTAPVELNKISDNEIEVKMIKMKLGEPDQSGRRRPIPINGSEYTVVVNHLIKAIGQEYDEYAFGERIKTKQGKIDFDAKIPVFCAGDMAWGGTVVEAIGSGNLVAKEVDAALQNKHYDKENEVLHRAVTPKDIKFDYYPAIPRIKNKTHFDENLYMNFDEVVEGLSEEEVVNESGRCLHCGDCFECGNCFNFCPDAAIFLDEQGRLNINYDYCKGCGICYYECPCSAIDFTLGEVEHD